MSKISRFDSTCVRCFKFFVLFLVMGSKVQLNRDFNLCKTFEAVTIFTVFTFLEIDLII